MQTANIQSVSTDQTEWEKKLVLYKEELVALNKQLIELAAKSNNKEALAHIEHFHNQFVIQNENIDILKHDLHQHTKKIKKSLEANSESLSYEEFESHQQLKDQFESEIKVYFDLKDEFAAFLAKAS